MRIFASWILGLSVGVLSLAAPCWAQAGLPNTATMSCPAARQLVSTRGAIVLATGPTEYDRYVSNGGFCTNDEIAKPAFVRSGTEAQCFIGYYCFPKASEQNR